MHSPYRPYIPSGISHTQTQWATYHQKMNIDVELKEVQILMYYAYHPAGKLGSYLSVPPGENIVLDPPILEVWYI